MKTAHELHESHEWDKARDILVLFELFMSFVGNAFAQTTLTNQLTLANGAPAANN
jgi:hypothetical protein